MAQRKLTRQELEDRWMVVGVPKAKLPCTFGASYRGDGFGRYGEKEVYFGHSNRIELYILKEDAYKVLNGEKEKISIVFKVDEKQKSGTDIIRKSKLNYAKPF